MNKWSLKRLSGPISILAIGLLLFSVTASAENCRVGDPIDCIIQRAGPPTSVLTMPDKSFYTWKISYTETSPMYEYRFRGIMRGQSMIYGGDTSEHWCQITFEVDSDNRIVGQTAQGPDCPK